MRKNIFIIAVLILAGVAMFNVSYAANSDQLETPIRVAVLPITFEEVGSSLGFDSSSYSLSSMTIALSFENGAASYDSFSNPFANDIGSGWSAEGILFQSRPAQGSAGSSGAGNPRPRAVYPGTIYPDLYGSSTPTDSTTVNDEGDTMVWYRPDNPPDRISGDGSYDDSDDYYYSETDSDENTVNSSYDLDSDFLTDYLITQMVNYSEFDLVDRDSFEEIFDEQELSMSGITEDNLSNVGQLLGVDYLLKTKISVIDGEEFYVLARLIAVDTGQIPKTDTVFSSVSLERRGLMQALADLAERLADKVNGKNPGKHEGVLDDSSDGFSGAVGGTYSTGLEISYLGGLLLTHPGSILNGARVAFKLPGESAARWQFWANADFLMGGLNPTANLYLAKAGVHSGYNIVQNGYMNLLLGVGYDLGFGFLHNPHGQYNFYQHGLVANLEFGFHVAPQVVIKLEGELLWGFDSGVLGEDPVPDNEKAGLGIDTIEEYGGLTGILWGAKIGFLF